MKRKEVDRIPYETWINSQLSIARHYGAITINGKRYEYDRDIVVQMMKDEKLQESENKLYKVDLVCYE